MYTGAAVPRFIFVDDCVPCRDSPEAFLPPTFLNSPLVEIAKSICSTCGVQQACLDWAVDRPWVEGVYGGTTPLERRRIRMGRKGGDRRGRRTGEAV